MAAKSMPAARCGRPIAFVAGPRPDASDDANDCGYAGMRLTYLNRHAVRLRFGPTHAAHVLEQYNPCP
jgi:hypothetical protein